MYARFALQTVFQQHQSAPGLHQQVRRFDHETLFLCDYLWTLRAPVTARVEHIRSNKLVNNLLRVFFNFDLLLVSWFDVGRSSEHILRRSSLGTLLENFGHLRHLLYTDATKYFTMSRTYRWQPMMFKAIVLASI